LANVEWNVLVKADTIFQSGSVGKQFAATAVMMLVEEGKVGLDDPVQEYFSDAPDTWKNIKIRNLLSHTSALGEYENAARTKAHMQDTFRGARTLRFLWHERHALCTVCNTKITRITGWRLHHCVPRVMGGSQSAENRVLLHPECHDRVHRQRIPVSSRVSPKEAFEGLELCEVNFHAQFLEGWTGAIPSGYSVIRSESASVSGKDLAISSMAW
jgi:hypothetical protein